MRFVHVRLQAPASRAEALDRFYASTLGVPSASPSAYRIGETTLELAVGAGEPFYHFAFLVPGNRFDAALAWAQERTSLLPERRSGDVVFDFDFWQAKACYFLDPAGSIVELIAHRGVGENDEDGDFDADELVGLSELGLVGDPPRMAGVLARRLGLELWDGSVEQPGGLGFVGERARTLILAPLGRGWLPTGRPSELHGVDVTLSGPPRREALLEESRYRLRRCEREEDPAPQPRT